MKMCDFVFRYFILDLIGMYIYVLVGCDFLGYF